jgi:hypothetical protein
MRSRPKASNSLPKFLRHSTSEKHAIQFPAETAYLMAEAHYHCYSWLIRAKTYHMTKTCRPASISKSVARDTELDLVLAPGAFWSTRLKQKLEELLLPQKKRRKMSFQADDTNVAVCVKDRSERDLIKRFNKLDIDWTVIEKQLLSWSHLFRAGRKLRINISFNYSARDLAIGTSVRRATKRGSSQRILAQREVQLNAEEETSGHPSIWRDVYNLMRCPGPPCHLGPHCWRDSVGKKHYKLKTHHMKILIEHVEQGGTLQTHDDVPEHVREQLYAEEQQDVEHQWKRRAPSLASSPPIHITNVLPG